MSFPVDTPRLQATSVACSTPQGNPAALIPARPFSLADTAIFQSIHPSPSSLLAISCLLPTVLAVTFTTNLRTHPCRCQNKQHGPPIKTHNVGMIPTDLVDEFENIHWILTRRNPLATPSFKSLPILSGSSFKMLKVSLHQLAVKTIGII